MGVSEQLEESRTEVLGANGVHAEPATEETESARPSAPAWLPLAYSIEFLVALMAVITVWSEIGGQGHLDLMPWYTKLACVLAASWACVRFTAAMVEGTKAWNQRTALWLAGLILVGVTIAGITYYYHLHEETDQPDSDDTTTAAMNGWPASGSVDLTNDRIVL
jgi:hypothetical protein